jgi:hypothetical protein
MAHRCVRPVSFGRAEREIVCGMTPRGRRVPCQIIDFNEARLRRSTSRSEIDLLELVATAQRSPGRLAAWTLPKGTALVFDNPGDANERPARFVTKEPLPLAPICAALNAADRSKDADGVANSLCILGLWLKQDVIAAIV